MSRLIKTNPLTANAFAPYGDVLEAVGLPDKIINQGKCGRFHDKATLDFTNGRAGISIFQGEKRTLPLTLELVERHPAGSQTFVPMSAEPFLVVVAADNNGTPTNPKAFLTQTGQAINFHRNTWHGVLTPLSEPGLFAVIDRIGPKNENGDVNLQEHWFADPYTIDT